MNNIFEVGDLVMMLDGPEESKKIGRLAGSVGTVVAIQKHDITEEECQVEFDMRGNYMEKWWVIPEWIEPVCQLSDSDELNSMFEEIGGST